MTASEKTRIECILSEIMEDLKFCQAAVESESRLELAVEILQEINSRIENEIMKMDLTEEEQNTVKDLYQRARILLHRAYALISMRDKEQEKFLPKRV